MPFRENGLVKMIDLLRERVIKGRHSRQKFVVYPGAQSPQASANSRDSAKIAKYNLDIHRSAAHVRMIKSHDYQ
jgi:hypothetical protein